MAAANADELWELNVAADPGVRGAGMMDMSPQACIARLIEHLLARVALLEHELALGKHREVKLRELLHSTEFLLNEYKELYFQINEGFENVSRDLEQTRRDCICRRRRLVLFRTRSH